VTASDAVKLKLIALHGWTASVMVKAGDGGVFYRAVDNGDANNKVTGVSIEHLFEQWLENPAVLYDVLRIKKVGV